MTTFIFAALLSAFLHPWAGVISKKAAHPITVNCWALMIMTVVFVPLIWIRDLWPLIIEHWPWVIATSVLKSAYGISVMYLLGRNNFQIFYPLTRVAPILVFVGELFWFGNAFSMTIFLGIMAVTTGALIFGLDREIEHLRLKVLGVILGLTLCIVAFELMDKKLLEFFTPAELLSFTLFQLPFNLFPLCYWRKEAKTDLCKNGHYIVIMAITMAGSFYASRWAMGGLDASVVASLRNLSILFGVFLGAHLFDEGHKWLRYVAAALIIIGAGLVMV